MTPAGPVYIEEWQPIFAIQGQFESNGSEIKSPGQFRPNGSEISEHALSKLNGSDLAPLDVKKT